MISKLHVYVHTYSSLLERSELWRVAEFMEMNENVQICFLHLTELWYKLPITRPKSYNS